ncbi:MAG: serine/threonine-protein kinase [Planctomycetota bacterium]|nr:serine/threonine-protein kinase [Planctomycetota bacterium]
MPGVTFEVHFQHNDCERLVVVKAGETHLIGRSSDASFFLSHGSVSRRHCQLVGHPHGIEVQDLGSRNGVFLNGHRIDRLFLPSRSILQVGRLGFSVNVCPNSEQKLKCASCGKTIPLTPLKAHNPDLKPWCQECEEVQLLRSHEQIDAFLDSEGFQPGKKLTERPYSFVTTHPQLDDQEFRVNAIPLPFYDNSREFDNFRKEARSVAKLEHPGLLRLLDVRSANDVLYILTEYAPGKTLRQHIETEGPLPMARALSYIRSLFEILSYTSEQKVYHHYLTPDFLTLSDESSIRVIDIRLNQYFRVMSALGRVNEEVGGFRAPELYLELLDADVRADLYSIGALLYYMVTGKKPYRELTSKSVARAAMLKIPVMPPLQDIHPALHKWLSKALHTDPASRFQNVSEAQKSLDKAAMNALMPDTESAHDSIGDSEASRKAFSGTFLGPQLAEILHILEDHKRHGHIEIVDDASSNSTRLTYLNGAIIDARCNSETGRSVIKSIMDLRFGSYYFDPQRPAEDADPSTKESWMFSKLVAEFHEENNDSFRALFPS